MSRLAARLAKLPHDVLAEVAAQLCEEEPATARRITDAILAEHDPLPASMVSGVLLSPDLIRYFFAFLEQRDCAAACVCQLWLHGWGSTDDVRRGLRAKPCATPDCNMADIREIAAHPSGTWLCLSMRDHSLRLVDSGMRTFRHFSASSLNISSTEGLIVSDDRIIVGWGEVGPAISCFDFMGARVMEYVEESDDHDAFFHHLALARDGTLFAAPRWYGSNENEVVALDSATLGVRFRFKTTWEYGRVAGMALAGEELFVGGVRAVHVFSLSGQPLREINGTWRQSANFRPLIHVNGRLYLTEEPGMTRGPNTCMLSG